MSQAKRRVLKPAPNAPRRTYRYPFQPDGLQEREETVGTDETAGLAALAAAIVGRGCGTEAITGRGVAVYDIPEDPAKDLIAIPLLIGAGEPAEGLYVAAGPDEGRRAFFFGLFSGPERRKLFFHARRWLFLDLGRLFDLRLYDVDTIFNAVAQLARAQHALERGLKRNSGNIEAGNLAVDTLGQNILRPGFGKDGR